MNKEERQEIYNKWLACSVEKEQKKQEEIKFTQSGEYYYDKDREDPRANEEWLRADECLDRCRELEIEMKNLYSILEQTAPLAELEKFESCGQLRHSVKYLVKLRLLDGSEEIGYIYPWESDYSGEPYCFIYGEYNSWYLGDGELVYSVTKVT